MSGALYIYILIAGFFINLAGDLFVHKQSIIYLSFLDFENPPCFLLVVDCVLDLSSVRALCCSY